MFIYLKKENDKLNLNECYQRFDSERKSNRKKVQKFPNYVAKILIYPESKLKNCPKSLKISGKFILKSCINLGARSVGGLELAQKLEICLQPLFCLKA